MVARMRCADSALLRKWASRGNNFLYSWIICVLTTPGEMATNRIGSSPSFNPHTLPSSEGGRPNSRARFFVAIFKAHFDRRYAYQPPTRLLLIDASSAEMLTTMDEYGASGLGEPNDDRPCFKAFNNIFVTRSGPTTFTWKTSLRSMLRTSFSEVSTRFDGCPVREENDALRRRRRGSH